MGWTVCRSGGVELLWADIDLTDLNGLLDAQVLTVWSILPKPPFLKPMNFVGWTVRMWVGGVKKLNNYSQFRTDKLAGEGKCS